MLKTSPMLAAGANQYWMNSNGEYIGTQLQNYNPNLDDNMNEQRRRN
jgi:predicted oxidoreductase (fatty acid repression mutant protein)